MNTTKNNKLIAEFMGWGEDNGFLFPPNDKSMNTIDGWYSKDIPYHTSWDWLMPVVEKIEEISIDDTNLIIKEHRYEFDMKHTQCEIYDRVRDCVVASGDMGSKILSTYQSVVEFINQN